MTPEDWQEFQEFLAFKRMQREGAPAPVGGKKELTVLALFKGGYELVASRRKSWSSVGRCHWGHLLRLLGDKPVSEIDFQTGYDYQNARLAEKRLVPGGDRDGKRVMKPGARNVKPATINNEMNSLRALLNWAVKCKKISDNPLTSHPDLDIEKKRQFHCAEKDFLAILAHVPPLARLMFILSYETGMRRDEFRLLEWSEVNLRAETPTITLPPHRVKGGKKGRTIALSQLAVDVIKAAPRLIPSKFVFPNPLTNDGAEYPRGTLSHQFMRARGKAGVKGPGDENYWIHSLRKSYAVNQVMNNMPVYDLMDQLGHSSYDVHLEYTKMAPGHLKKVAERLNDGKRLGPRPIEDVERERMEREPDGALRSFVIPKP